MTDHRFIEESFPVKAIGAASAKEKNMRHGYISTLHVWWARRPLAASRATAYTALTPAPTEVEAWHKRQDFTVNLSQWDNSLNSQLLGQARQEILAANHGKPPRVLDPFAGGGSYPLEALRLGCETYANDYNPVAVIVLKATVEYPWRFGRSAPGPSTGVFGTALTGDRGENRLLEAVRHWGSWVLAQATRQLGEYYPRGSDGSIPVGYIWARTIPCQNPRCRAQIPLIRSFMLSKKGTNCIALYPEIEATEVNFRVVGDGYDDWPVGFEPEAGFVSNGIALCPHCHSTLDEQSIMRLFVDGANGQRMIAVLLTHPRTQGKIYRAATHQDELVYHAAADMLEKRREEYAMEWGLDPIPDEPITRERPSPNARGTSGVTRYHMNTWGDLFNARQKLSLITFTQLVREAYDHILAETGDQEFSTAVTTYLAMGVDRLADFGSTLCALNPTGGRGVLHTFSRQALQMTSDYAESNPFNQEGAGWPTACEKNEKWIQHASAAATDSARVVVTHGSATTLPYENNYFDAILTDPPYYDNVPYSHLADFFYVWLKRSIGQLYPDLFSTPLTSKSGEIVAYTLKQGGFEAGTRFFEQQLTLSFKEMERVLKPEGVAVIVYAHKSTEGWETVVNALVGSGLTITSAWPVNTEMKARLNANETASLASSIYIVARKMPRQPTGFYNDVRDELRQHLNAKLHRLWEEGISGADFFIAAIGSAIEVFGKYEQVIDYEGSSVRADRLLEDVRTIATDYAVRQILHDGFAGEISDLTRFYVLWRWEYGEARVPFDEARKLAQSCGLDISREWGRVGFIKKDKEFIQVLGPQARKLEALATSHEMIDVLHRVLLLWEQGKRAEMVSALAASGYGASEAFYRVAQATSETLPNESKEKKLLDGFLAGRGRVRDEVEQIVHRPTLWQE